MKTLLNWLKALPELRTVVVGAGAGAGPRAGAGVWAGAGVLAVGVLAGAGAGVVTGTGAATGAGVVPGLGVATGTVDPPGAGVDPDTASSPPPPPPPQAARRQIDARRLEAVTRDEWGRTWELRDFIDTPNGGRSASKVRKDSGQSGKVGKSDRVHPAKLLRRRSLETLATDAPGSARFPSAAWQQAPSGPAVGERSAPATPTCSGMSTSGSTVTLSRGRSGD